MQLYEEIIADREVGTKRLVSEYRARLTTAAEMLCRDPHEAEDLVFRAFEQAILHINDFRPTGSFYYWIYTILLNFHRMDLRKKSSRPEVYHDAQLPDIEDDKDQFAEFAFRIAGLPGHCGKTRNDFANPRHKPPAVKYGYRL